MKNAPMSHMFSKLSLIALAFGLAISGGACGSDSPSTNNDAGGGGGSGGGADPARYNFESGVQGWAGAGTILFTSVTTSTAQKFAGTSSLSGLITAADAVVDPYGLEVVLSPLGTIPASGKVMFHVYVPAGAAIDWVQPYIQESDGAPSPYRFTSQYTTATPGSWQNIEVTAPADVTPILKVGVQFHVTGAWTGSVYVDSVNW